MRSNYIQVYMINLCDELSWGNKGLKQIQQAKYKKIINPRRRSFSWINTTRVSLTQTYFFFNTKLHLHFFFHFIKHGARQ